LAQQPFGNHCVTSLAVRPEDKDSMMVMVFELMAMPAALALGFVLGRIWEIRREIRRNHFRRRYLASPWRQANRGLGGLPISL
jgi:hypothetical protein